MSMLRYAIALAVPVFFASATDALAETISDGTQFKASEHMIAHLKQYDLPALDTLGIGQEKALELAITCGTGYQLRVLDSSVMESIDFPAESVHPVKGA